MSLYSKANLAVRDLASTDRKDPGLRRIQFEADGTTVAANGRAVIAVSPPDAERAAMFPAVETEHATPPPEGVGVSPESVAKIASLIPRGEQQSLHYAQMTRCNDVEVELLGTDGYRKEKCACVPCRGAFPNWRGPVGAAMRAANKSRVCVDRKSLLRVLQALEKACPDPGGYNPVFIEFGGPGDALVLRSVNYTLAQRAVAIVKPLLTDDQWLAPDAWEEEIRDGREEMRDVPAVRQQQQEVRAGVPEVPDTKTPVGTAAHGVRRVLRRPGS